MKTLTFLFVLAFAASVAGAQFSDLSAGRYDNRVQHKIGTDTHSPELGSRIPSTLGRPTGKGNIPSHSPIAKNASSSKQPWVIDTALALSINGGQFHEWVAARHIYTFNARNKMTAELTQRLVGEVWVDSERRTTVYDDRDSMLTELLEYSSSVDVQWMFAQRHTWTYDAVGNKLTELAERRVEGQWMAYSRYTWTYDAQGNMLSELLEWDENGQLVSTERHTWTYDAMGNKLTELLEYPSNGRLSWSQRYAWTYDSLGNRVSELAEWWSNSQWMIGGRATWTYEERNRNRLSEVGESYAWQDGRIQESWCYNWSYDANGNRLSESYYSGVFQVVIG